MVEFFERETEMHFVPTLYPDYHPDAPGGVDIGRSILAAPYDIRGLGKDMARLKPPLKTITFIGMMFNSSNADLKHFFQATKSLTSFVYVARRLVTHMKELLLYRRGINVTSGNALAARLAASALKLGIPIHTESPVREIVFDAAGRATGVRSEGLAAHAASARGTAWCWPAAGFRRTCKRIAQAYPHVRRGGEHLSPTPLSNTGDGINLAEAAGAVVDIRFKDSAAWMPVSRVPYGNGEFGVFPHLLDRYKPGVIGVLRSGRRFTNESNSYHDVGAALVRACEGQKETAMWLVCDKPTLAKYGLGFVKPAPMPLGKHLRNGYLLKGDTLAELAKNAGIDAAGLEAAVASYNVGAVRGEDPEFHRGTQPASTATWPTPRTSPTPAWRRWRKARSMR
jgi:succinate dehydrogenase/fumarate reductase flavoprotein subunit